MSATTPTYRSDFGGLWTDRTDAAEEIDRRLSGGQITDDQASSLRFWIEKGYIVLEGAVDVDAIDRFHSEISKAFVDGDERLLISTPGTPGGGYVPLTAGLSSVRARVVDSYAFYDTARELLFSKAIVDWMRLVFEDDPMLFQSLSFDRGSQQGMHQDTAYVVVDSPLRLAATWIALEDITEGSGELMYYEGSHQLPDFKFSGEFKHWNPGRDGDEQHQQFLESLNTGSEERGYPRKTFLPKKGDVLIWAADLAHGGAPATNEELTRRSLVGHYCPRQVKPNYFLYRDDRSTVLDAPNGGFLCSEHYDLAAVQAAPTPQAEPAAAPAEVEPAPTAAPDDVAAAPEPTAAQPEPKKGFLAKLLGR